MSATRYLPGSPRLFNNHSVCTECGAMIDNEFIYMHEVSHGREPDANVHNEVQRVAAEIRREALAPMTWEPIPKGARRRFWPFS